MDRPLVWIFLLFPVVFVLFWSGICLLLTTVSGWRGLASRYAGRFASAERSVGMGSGRMGVVSFRNVLNVSAGPEGVELALLRIFAIGAPPLAIPWSAVRAASGDRLLGIMDRVKLEVEGGPSVILYGAAARLVDDGWRTWATEAGARQPARIGA
jgi:hypothetical protein